MNPEYQLEIVYYMMAKMFQFRPWEVDEIDYLMVLNMLHLESEYTKKQNEEMSRKR